MSSQGAGPGRVPAWSPAAADGLRRHNTALVLRALRDHGPASRAEIATRTGLAKATVGTIVGRLLAAGALVGHEPVPDREVVPPVRGRPGRPVRLDGAGTVGLGLEVNVDYLAAVALDLSGATRLFIERPVRAAQEGHVLAALLDLARTCHDQLVASGRDVLGVTVAVPGLVDRRLGRVTSAPNLGWSDLDLAAEVATVVGSDLVVSIDNDANCAALAEVERGAAVGLRDVLYLTGTVGVGGGLVVDGSIARGCRGYAGEVGHMSVGGSTAACACGRRGCWEAQVGLRATLTAVGMQHAEEDRDADPVEVASRIARQAPYDPVVQAGLEQVGSCLGVGISMLANALNPQMVVLGGYFVPLGPWLLPAVEHALAHDVFAPAGGGCTVALSPLGLQAAAIGAAAEVLGQVYAGRLDLPG